MAVVMKAKNNYIVRLNANENPLGASPHVVSVVQKEAAGTFIYPDNDCEMLKKSLAKYYNISFKQLLVGNGSAELLVLMAQAFADNNSDIIYSQYGFIMYPIAIKIVNAKAIVVPAKGLAHDLDTMAKSISEKTKLIFIANPNNPTNTLITHQELETFLAKIPQNVMVVVDEAYYEYASMNINYPDSSLLQNKFPNLIITRTFSKARGMAGFRIGYCIAHPDVIRKLDQFRLLYNVNILAQKAAVVSLLDNDYLFETLESNRMGINQLTKGLSKLGLDYMSSDTNFITINFKQRALSIYNELLENGIMTSLLDAYGMPNYLRISIGLLKENAYFLKILSKILSN